MILVADFAGSHSPSVRVSFVRPSLLTAVWVTAGLQHPGAPITKILIVGRTDDSGRKQPFVPRFRRRQGATRPLCNPGASNHLSCCNTQICYIAVLRRSALAPQKCDVPHILPDSPQSRVNIGSGIREGFHSKDSFSSQLPRFSKSQRRHAMTYVAHSAADTQ